MKQLPLHIPHQLSNKANLDADFPIHFPPPSPLRTNTHKIQKIFVALTELYIEIDDTNHNILSNFSRKAQTLCDKYR